VQHVQAKLGIRPTTGIVDDRTWQALASAGILVQRDAAKYRAPNGAEKDALFGPLKCEPLVAGQAGGPVRILNSFRQRIVSVVVPQLKGVQGTVAGQVQWHRDYVSELLGAFRAIEDAGLKDRIVSCAGTWV